MRWKMLLSPTVTKACSYVQMVNKYIGNRCQVAVEELKCISALCNIIGMFGVTGNPFRI